MFVLVALLIMISIYVIKNDKISEKSRTGWFIFLGAIGVLTLLGAILF